jgi:hypothetical protein
MTETEYDSNLSLSIIAGPNYSETSGDHTQRNVNG